MTSHDAHRRMNVNDHVWVRLTELGWKVFDGHHLELGLDPAPYRAQVGGSEGLQRFQLWELMNIFGPVCTLGRGGVFDGGSVWLANPNAEVVG